MVEKDEYHPRGLDVMLPHGGLPEVIPPYLRKLISETGGYGGPIGLQFIARPQLETEHYFESNGKDPLLEEEHEVAPGLIYKYQSGRDEFGEYPGRALFTVTRNCGAYCRYCTRGREVGIPPNMNGPFEGALSFTPHLSKGQIDESISFIKEEPGLREVIVSGGDPLTLRPEVLNYVLHELGCLQKEDKLDIVRVGTRLPIHNPSAIKPWHYEALKNLQNPKIMLHANCSEELTPEAIEVLTKLRKETDGIVMTQSVLLKGVNDSVSRLRSFFIKAASYNLIPYYVYQNDPLPWAKHFTVPIDEAINMWMKLRPTLSGVAATAKFVIDTPKGYGKIPIPEGNAWNIVWKDGFRDYKGDLFSLY